MPALTSGEVQIFSVCGPASMADSFDFGTKRDRTHPRSSVRRGSFAVQHTSSGCQTGPVQSEMRYYSFGYAAAINLVVISRFGALIPRPPGMMRTSRSGAGFNVWVLTVSQSCHCICALLLILLDDQYKDQLSFSDSIVDSILLLRCISKGCFA